MNCWTFAFMPECLLAVSLALFSLVAVFALSQADSRSAGSGVPAGAHGPLGANMSVGLIFLDAADEYIYANRTAEEFLGVGPGELTGRTAHDASSAVRTPVLIAADVLRHGGQAVMTGRFPLGGRTALVEFARAEAADGSYDGMAVTITDMTENCEFCGHVMRAERMTVLGELAAAMAHEINSPLSGVMESIRIIQKNAGNWEKIERFLPLVQQGLSQIDQTVKQMLKFAVPQEAPRTRLVLEEVISKCVEFLEYRQDETGSGLAMNLSTVRTIVRASDHALSQVLINLINNAFDAVAASGGGTVEVRSALLPESGEVMVQIADTGAGIAPNVRARIFEPFFTTKPSGGGTGLGLSICARIVARLGGRIMVSESESGGALFSLVLPLVGEESGGPDA